MQALSYAYNTQANCLTGTTQSSLVLSRHPPSPTTFDRPPALPTDTSNATVLVVLQSKLLHLIDLMRQKTDKMLTAVQRRYKDYHDRSVWATCLFKPGYLVYIDRQPLPVTVADGLVTDLCSILLLPKLGPRCILSSTTESVTINEEGTPSTISSDRASLAPQSEIDESATGAGASASHQSEYREGLPGDFSATDLPTGTRDAQRRAAKGISRTTNDVKHDEIWENTKCSKRKRNDDREYTIDHIVCHAGGGANTPYDIRWYGYSAANDTIKLSANIPTNFIERYWRKKKGQTKRVKRQTGH